jgi:hypothetical protein
MNAAPELRRYVTESQHAAIKSQRAIKVGDFQMNMPDPRSRDDGG